MKCEICHEEDAVTTCPGCQKQICAGCSAGHVGVVLVGPAIKAEDVIPPDLLEKLQDVDGFVEIGIGAGGISIELVLRGKVDEDSEEE
ncbi:hypothetical protein ACFL1M_02930 [Patescibacteria group bacterium]